MNKLLIGALALILVAAGGYVWYTNMQQAKNPQQVETSTTSQEATSPSTLLEGGNAIMVEEQAAGDIAYIDLAVLEEPGFVVVYAVNADGSQGELVGHSDYYQKGQSEDVPVEIDPAMKTGETYIAILHGDDGDKDFGSGVEDKPLKDEDGKEVSMKFKVGAAAPTVEE